MNATVSRNRKRVNYFSKNYLFYRPWRVDEVSPTTRQNIFTIFTIFFDAAASADGRRESESRRKIPQHVLSASRELQRTGERYYKDFYAPKAVFYNSNAPALVV
jgi:hypothetical protein